MKANEAPEKIYLFENPISGTPDDRWLSKRSDENDIEYTHTDAFIEKAIEWFEQNLHMYNTSECLGDRKEFIEDFKKAMKL